jgi:AraC-like DNA-binding protein
LALSPLGARAVLGVPAGELANLDVEGAAVLGPLAAEVQQRLQSCATWPQRFALLDRLLQARVARAGSVVAGSDGAIGADRTEVSAEVRHAWRLLLESGGQVSVACLAAETGWSDRHLRSQFRVEIGMSPKAVARVVRFGRTRRALVQRLRAGQRPGLADLAVWGGYFDQAHLDRDFGELAGCSPTAWLAQEFRNFQASPPLPAPG